MPCVALFTAFLSRILVLSAALTAVDSQNLEDDSVLNLLQLQAERHHAHAGPEQGLSNHPRLSAPPEAESADFDALGLKPGDAHNLIFSEVVYSNLGGLGPDTDGPQGLRYSRVTRLHDGRDVDVLIVADNYNTAKPHKNGVYGKMGVVNVLNGNEPSFTLSFLEHDTENPVTLGPFFLSFSDLDQGKAGGAETLTIDGFNDAKVLSRRGSQIIRVNSDKGTHFMSTTHGVGADNPTDPLMLTDLQAARTVSLKFPAGFSKVTFKYKVDRNADLSDSEGRHFLLAGLSSLYFCEAKVEDMDFEAATIVYNNLGNKGPNLEDPHELRYGNIMRLLATNESLDLVVTALTPYEPFRPWVNGKSGHFGNIHLKARSKVSLRFQFVKPGTHDAVSIPWFYFTWYDMDHGKWGANKAGYNETIVLGDFLTHFLTENTEIAVKRLPNNRFEYSSTKPGTGKDNPKDPMKLTQAQKDRGVTFLFHNKDAFEVDFDIGGLATKGRNYVFAGKSQEVFCEWD